MIKNMWYVVLTSREVPRNRPVGVRRFGEQLVLWRDADGQVCCAADRCIHRGAALSAGTVDAGHVVCPFHGFQYDRGGRCRRIPALGRTAQLPERFRTTAYPAREAHGLVYIYWGEQGSEPAELPYFSNLEGLQHSTFCSAWPVHYSRAIENQLDVVHLPFVHHNTIGRGMGTLVNGPLVEWCGDDHLRFHVFNETDRGQDPRPAEDLAVEDSRVFLDFVYPNIWQNVLTPKLRIFAAFAPVDEDSTMIYLRLYQGLLTIPVLRALLELPMQLFNRIILNQDRRVVCTQQPRKTALKMDEQLIAGDRPIVEYRRRRQVLLERNQHRMPPQTRAVGTVDAQQSLTSR